MSDILPILKFRSQASTIISISDKYTFDQAKVKRSQLHFDPRVSFLAKDTLQKQQSCTKFLCKLKVNPEYHHMLYRSLRSQTHCSVHFVQIFRLPQSLLVHLHEQIDGYDHRISNLQVQKLVLFVNGFHLCKLCQSQCVLIDLLSKLRCYLASHKHSGGKWIGFRHIAGCSPKHCSFLSQLTDAH